MTSSQIGNAINRRFHTFDRGIKEGVAKPKTDEFIELKVHPRYKDNIDRYMPRGAGGAAARERRRSSMAAFDVARTPIARSDHGGDRGHSARSAGQGRDRARCKRARGGGRRGAVLRGRGAGLSRRQPRRRRLGPIGPRRAGLPRLRPGRAQRHGRLRGLRSPARSARCPAPRRATVRSGPCGPWTSATRWSRAKTWAGNSATTCSDTKGPADGSRHPQPSGRDRDLRPGPGVSDTPVARGRHRDHGQHAWTTTRQRHAALPSGEPDQKRVVSTKVDDVIRAIVDLGGTYPDVVQALQMPRRPVRLPGRFEMDAMPQGGRRYLRKAERDRRHETSEIDRGRADGSIVVVGNPLPDLFCNRGRPTRVLASKPPRSSGTTRIGTRKSPTKRLRLFGKMVQRVDD